MKKQFMLIAFALAIFGTFSSISAQVDLTMREALYFIGPKWTIDLKNDRYAAKGATLSVSAESAESCDGNICQFRVGVIVIRSGDIASVPSSYGVMSVEGGGTVGNSMSFVPRKTTRDFVLPVKLKIGMNRITCKIDRFEKTQETDETNNTFMVNVIVERPSQTRTR
jgi:hypothetical protein